MSHAIILISCPDQKGITAAVTDFVFKRGGNIVHADQHTDAQANTFFMRIEWELEGFSVARDAIAQEFFPLVERFAMTSELYFTDQPVKIAVFVSKHLHCLYDLLYRHKTGQLFCDIVLLISNHPHARGIANDFGIKGDVVECSKGLWGITGG